MGKTLPGVTDHSNKPDGGTSPVNRGAASSHRMDRAIAELRRFWHLGRDDLDKHLINSGDRNATTASETEKLGISREWLRKARRFAERCSLTELETCIVEARSRGYALFPSSLIEVYEMPSKSAQKMLWKAALTYRMSRREILATARAAKLTPAVRQAGSGRRVKMPAEPAAALQWVKEQVQFLQSILAAAEGVVAITPAKRRNFQGVQRAVGKFLKSIN